MTPVRHGVLIILAALAAWAQDPRDLVRRSIAQDQLDWVRMKDYTWQARSTEKRLDAHGKVEAIKREAWETLILDGEPYRRTVERDGKPLTPEEQLTEQKRLDKETRRLNTETPAEKQRRLEDAEKRRRREFAFLSEIPELFELRFEGEATVDGRPVWIVSGEPRPGAKARSSDAKMLLKVRGRMWIDRATYQWARVEAETTATVSWGLFLARLNSGAKLVFEQTEVNSELWLPKRLLLTGSGRVGLVKRLARDEEIEWSNYKRFSVESKIVSDSGAKD
jgi:hypothetical protein